MIGVAVAFRLNWGPSSLRLVPVLEFRSLHLEFVSRFGQSGQVRGISRQAVCVAPSAQYWHVAGSLRALGVLDALSACFGSLPPSLCRSLSLTLPVSSGAVRCFWVWGFRHSGLWDSRPLRHAALLRHHGSQGVGMGARLC
jgi:hypothetical protein